jgi:hypothetical protein
MGAFVIKLCLKRKRIPRRGKARRFNRRDIGNIDF